MGLTFDKMADLVNRYHWDYWQIFPDELILAIFWEESTFTNARQIGWKQGAVGFGQVEPSTVTLANLWAQRDYPDDCHWTPGGILTSERLAVQITSRVLARYYEALGSKHNALNAYAGTSNADIPPRWIKCQNALAAMSDYSDTKAVVAALKLAKPNSDPSAAFRDD
jgi:hypothetical protein